MENYTFDLIINILTYAIKNKEEGFSQKDFKNVVYTKEFDNYGLDDKIAYGFRYLLKRGLLQLKQENLTYYEKYTLSSTIKINIRPSPKIFKNLAKKILPIHENKEIVNSSYDSIIDSINVINSSVLQNTHKEELRTSLLKILISQNMQYTKNYSLFTIIQLLQLQSSIKIDIKTKNCEFSAVNVKFDYIKFNDETILLGFDKCSFEIDNVNNIINIDSIDSLNLQEDIDKSLKLLTNYNENEIACLKKILNDAI